MCRVRKTCVLQYETETEKDNKTKADYETHHGSTKETFEILHTRRPTKDPTRFNMQDAGRWYTYNKGNLKNQKSFNSQMAAKPLHEIQIDLLKYSLKQPNRQRVKSKALAGWPKERMNKRERQGS